MDYPASQHMTKDHDDFSDKKFRQTLNITIINNFLDLKASTSASNHATLSAFFHHMRNSFKEIPHIFVASPIHHDADESRQEKAFTEWLMMWLLHVLNDPSADSVHKECRDLFFYLLQLIKFNNTFNFRHSVMRLINLLAELNDMFDRFVDGNTETSIIENYFYSDEKLKSECAQELDLVTISVSFSTPYECEALQEKVTSLLEMLTIDITQFLPDQCNNLCKIFCIQIELGDLNLKKESVRGIASLVREHGLMFSISNIDYLFSCIQAITLFCSSFEEPISEVFRSLQDAIGVFLRILIEKVDKPESKFMLTTSTLGKMLQVLSEAVTKSYFLDSTQCFQSSVVTGIIFFLQHGKENGYLFPIVLQQQLSEFVVTSLSARASKFLLHLAVHLIKTEGESCYFGTNQNKEKFGGGQENNDVVCCCAEILLRSYSELHHIEKFEFQEFTLSGSQSHIARRRFPPLIIDSFNAHAKYLLVNNFSSTYEKIIKFYKQVLLLQDLLHLTDEHYDIICNVLSIPWILEEEDVQDLSDQFLSLHIIKKLNITIHNSVAAHCLQSLVLIPSRISLSWRSHILSMCLSCNTDLALTAVKMLPIFLYSSLNPLKFLFELNPCLLQLNNIDVLRELCKYFGTVCCICSGCCSLYRQLECDYDSDVVLPVKCAVCDKLQDSSDKSKPLPSPFVESLADLMIHILSHPSELIRRESMQAVLRFFTHFEVKENVLSATMHFLVDVNPVVRAKFSEVVGLALKPLFSFQRDHKWRQRIDELLMMKLQAALLASKQSGNVHFQKSIIYSIGEIGKISDGGLLLINIISLLENYMTSIPSVKVVAFSKLKQIAESKQLKMQDLLKAYKGAICKFLAEFLFARNPDDANQILFILEEIRTVFGYNDLKSFIHQNQHSILPYLIARETQCSSVFIETLATVLHIDKREILINNFPYIFSHFVCHCDKSDLEKALIFIQRETDLELGSLLRCNYQPVHNELLLHLSTHYQQVFSGLAILALKSGNLEGNNSIITHSEEMASYLQPKLLGFLVFFDAQMLKSSLDDKKLALESLIAIMKIMGSRAITAVRFKLMATLRLTLRFKDGDFPKICCKAWNTFVSSIEITSLGPLLNQIIVALLPLLEIEPVAVSEIFHYLIIEKRAYLSEFFHDLYFVPDTPELQQINVVLKDYSESPDSLTDFCSLLCHSLKGISHENLEVRLHALEKLKQVLHSNQKAIHDHLHGRESVDNLLSHLVAALIGGCRESDVRVRTALGHCLGELGAIDPGRLDMKSARSRETLANFYSSIDEEDFAYALIQELVHSFLAAEQSGIQDCSACAIQEVLRFYKCSNESGSSGNHLWKRFPPDIQEILIVLFHSQYKPLQKSRRKFPVPIYQSKMGGTFRDWTKNWFYSLLQKVKKENPFKLFHACSVIIKYDLNCTLFLLPHLVVYALLDCTEIEKNEICAEILTVLRHSEQLSAMNDLCQLSSQIVFSVVDHLTKWIHHYQNEISSKTSGRSLGPRLSQDKNFQSVNACLTNIPQILLAKSAFACQAYARALLHLEKYLKEFPDQLENHIGFIQKIYASLDDADGVAGVAAIRKEEPTLKDLILENEANGDMQAAFACYEKAIKLYPDEVSYYGGLLKCFLAMDQPTTAVSYANGILTERPDWKDNLNPFRIEAAWQLSNWESLESYLEEEENKEDWTVGVGNILYLANKKDVANFEKYVNIIRSRQMAPLSAASMERGAYLRGYEYLIRMHMLTDLQEAVQSIFNLNLSDRSPSKTVSLFNEILPTLSLRRNLLQSSSRYQEPIHNLHRVLLKIGKEKMPEFSSKFDQEITKCWLQSARLARKNGFYQRAYSCLLEAGIKNSADFFMEKTKWLWNKGEKEQAIYCLQKGISEHFPSMQTKNASSLNLSIDDQLICAKAKLLLAIYSEESSIVDSGSLIEMYKEVVNLQPDWEASHFHLAKYYDKMLNTTENPDAKAEIMIKVVRNFGTSLKHGCKNVYHSLPRLLDIWFDLGSLQGVDDNSSSSKKLASSWKSTAASLERISNMVQELYGSVPLYLFLTAFPQLVSRICHSHPSVSGPLQKLISRLLVSYPQQSMWMMMAVSKSSYPTRSKRCKQIFQEAILLNPSLGKYINDTTRLADKLIDLSNKNVGETNKLSISENFSSLSKLIDDRNFSQIMLPLQTQMIVTLPNGYVSTFDYNAFPFTPVFIQGFEDTVEVFPSLQKPKKLIVKGSDGKLYPIMCKPKDDLRKDCRLMEFNNLVNRYLKIDPEPPKAQGVLRTYAVVPLNEECGLIEWVPNLHGLRQILSKLYRLKGLFVTGREIRAMMPSKTATFEEKLNIFKNKFLPRFPPVFHEWFKIIFPDPTAWYHARLAYARTTAVMSMVGYIVGLGDRHGENILFDSSCGDSVHVDLNCLFNKGETMEYPECVPFRLTHNMVDAMGPTGYEGAFRKACEVTMRVMRSRTDALMSVLRPFVHDPLVEWSRSKNSKAQHDGEIINEQGLTHVKDIELRLNGIIKYKNKRQGLPLSIEGQVNHLIQEAVDIRNLSQMYIGWAAYM
ncbi:Serine/threonine-protein kinase ATR like protein [Argiope bruennichi]|uniref:Serine/threonine-protein kinase ATR n=1 Tax=Argiope bruennichi TaxID=94029 RepID=A0A8T0FUL8_ARGBR|nr:Serine/threonine-protein kinase ATR like protein [Argiope bruennichi]